MSTPKDWRAVTESDDWFRQQEKAQVHQERRPQIQKPGDLLGPGLRPFAVELADWNAEAAMFNGMWVALDADNAPAPGLLFGLTIGQQGGSALQIAAAPNAVMGGGTLHMRTVGISPVGIRTFGPWGPAT